MQRVHFRQLSASSIASDYYLLDWSSELRWDLRLPSLSARLRPIAFPGSDSYGELWIALFWDFPS